MAKGMQAHCTKDRQSCALQCNETYAVGLTTKGKGTSFMAAGTSATERIRADLGVLRLFSFRHTRDKCLLRQML